MRWTWIVAGLVVCMLAGTARADFMPVPAGGSEPNEWDPEGGRYRPDQGGPNGGASPFGWSAAFTNSTTTEFTHIAVIMLGGGDSLAEPGISDMTGSPSWSSVNTTVAATGDAVAIASDFGGDSCWSGGEGSTFTINFMATPTETVMFMVVGYDSDDDHLVSSEVVDADLALWDGLTWTMVDIGYHGGEFHPLSMVPIPAPFALGGVGMLGLLLARGRLRRMLS